MSSARDLRRCALQVLYQFDAGNESAESVRESLTQSSASEQDQREGFELARKAWEHRRSADEAVAILAPDWPTYRQPVIDRNILRLAYWEMMSQHAPPKVVINEAVELAKEFSTEKSPLFINGVLDKIYRNHRTSSSGSEDATDVEREIEIEIEIAMEPEAPALNQEPGVETRSDDREDVR